jgi:capsular polysaccharide biosynthesis protein
MLKKYLLKKMLRVYRRDKPELQRPLMLFLTRKWFLRRTIIDLSDYLLQNNDKVNILMQSNVDLHYSKIQFADNTTNDELLKEGTINNYAAVFKNAKIIPGSSLIILNETHLLYELKSNTKNENIDFSDDGISYIKGDLFIIKDDESKKVFERGILMTGNYDINFYHLMYEVLIKFDTLEKLNIDENVPLLFNKAVLNIQSFVDLITILNKDKRPIQALETLKIYEVKNLYHFSCNNIIPPNFFDITKIDNNDNCFYLDALAFLRKKILEVVKPIDKLKRIFIGRKKAGVRRNYNEEAVFEVLEKYGFEVFYPEEHTIEKQISIFNNADFIVGATGAAFTNLLFCDSTCKVICFTNYPLKVSIFSTIATFIGIELIYLYDHSLPLTKDTDLHEDFTVNITQLTALLKQKL